MEAKDLMVGDKLKTVFSQKIVKVKEIKQSCIYTEDNGYEYNEIEPIPLTHEILEKNGFKCDAHPNYICDSYFIDGMSLLDFRGGYFKYVTITLGYVHQLQHLLKLLNIDKEIEL